jgi:NDP-sugar pyrophosphorylase family protein
LREYSSGLESANNYIVTNADHILQPEYYNLLQKEIKLNSNQTCLVAHKLEDHNLAKNYGVIVVDENSNYQRIVEKPQEYSSSLISIGLYYLPSYCLEFFGAVRNPQYEGEEGMPELINNIARDNNVLVLVCEQEYLTASSQDDLERLNKMNF